MTVRRDQAPNPLEPRLVDLPLVVDVTTNSHLPALDTAKIFAGPAQISDRARWREVLTHWREDARARVAYDDLAYRQIELSKSPCYNLALMWIWDEILFDFNAQRFTPEKLLADAERFGNFDGVILWHAYPVIGIDSRNQFDFYEQIEGLAALVKSLQEAGIKVFLNYNPWDRWTTRPEGTDSENLARIISNYGFDGVFLDTMKSAEPNFLEPMRQVNPHLIIGGESAVQLERISDHVISWAQWMADSEVPGVLRAHWFERRHIQHQVRRWNRTHWEELQISWLNGTGMLIWEAVFGTWVGWNDRDARMLQEMVIYQREFHQLLVYAEWTPLCDLFPGAQEHGIFASKFESPDMTLWTVINKSKNDYQGTIISGFDALIPAHGVAGIVRDRGGVRALDFSYMSQSDEFPHRDTVRIHETRSTKQGDEKSPTFSIAGELTFTYRNRECGAYGHAPYINAWKPLPPDYHQTFSDSLKIELLPFRIDEFEVSNAQFYEFMQATHYEPKSQERFLQHWIDGKPTSEQMNSPVTFVELDDARAYASWRGARLPSEWEWQIAAADNHIKRLAPIVWNLTGSEHSDGRTRFVILKGGSEYSAQGHDDRPASSGILESDWYIFGGLRQPHQIEKLLLMGCGLSRSENISFRCAYDVS